MRRISFLFLLVAVAGLCHADLRSEVLAARRKQEKAVIAKDIKKAEAAMRESMTPDFKYVQGADIQDTKTFISNFKAGIVMMDKITSSSTRILSLKQIGNHGLGKLEYKMIATMKGSDKKIHTVNWVGIFTNKYRKVGGKWKTAEMTAGPQKFLMDGKPAKM